MAFSFREWDDVKLRPVSPWGGSVIERELGNSPLETAFPSASEMNRLSAWSPGRDITDTASAGVAPSFADWLAATYGGRREEEENEDLLENALAD